MGSYRYFFKKFIRPYIPTMAFLIALEFISMFFSFVTPLLAKSLIDDVFIGGKTELINYVILGTVGTYIISSFSSFLSSYKQGELELIIFNNVTKETFNAIQLAPIKRSQERKVGDLLSRIIANTRSAIVIFTQIIPQIFVGLARMIIPFTIMLFYNWHLTLIVTIPALLFLLPMSIFGGRLEKMQKTSLEKTALIYSFLKENLSITPLIKAFGLETWAQDKFDEQIKNYYDASIDYTKNNSMGISANVLAYGVPMVLLIIFGAPMVIQGSLTIGTFTLFTSNVALIFGPISQFAFLWSYYKTSSPAFDRVNEILRLERDGEGNERLVIKDGVIKFEDAWFSYDNRPILQGFNSTFKKGLNYVVGDNGSGKSTILKLLCSLYSLDCGQIKIDEQDISKIRRADLQKNISMIFSDPYLFDGSIYENICIGNLSASKEDIISAAKQVRVHEFIMSLPRGYEMQVGESGLKLSSGEKQKIALARAVLKNSPIILLDEVTKSVDMESRRSINEVIKSLKNEKTIIIITHNINEIEKEGNIVYLGQGNQQKDCTYRSVEAPLPKVEFHEDHRMFKNSLNSSSE
ncbi:MAG: ABC transporter ATP-binding protein [Methanotrichaceae archaeon]